MPIVSRKDFDKVVAYLSKQQALGFDCETLGLKYVDRLFSIIFADSQDGYYFNFNTYSELHSDFILPREWIKKLSPIFSKEDLTLFIHNAKFDAIRMHLEGVEISAKLWCTYAHERVIKNDLFPESEYSLAACALRNLKKEKDPRVEEYIQRNKLFTKVKIPGKKKEDTLLHFDKVPFDMISSYAIQDAKLHLELGLWQQRELIGLATIFRRTDESEGIAFLAGNERMLTKTCLKMETKGILLDVDYTREALREESEFLEELKQEFEELTSLEYSDGPKVLKEAFKKLNLAPGKTEKGNDSFAADVLEAMKNPVADLVNRIRSLERRVGTYFSSFLYMMDSNGVLHPNMKQAGTETGRFSYSQPNLQNVPKEDEPEDQDRKYHVRECFKPRDGFTFVSIDYEQQEFRVLLDYAGETKLIKKVLAGADVHQATAELCKITRKQAKGVGFATLYGVGLDKLAEMLGVSRQEASEIREAFFGTLPKVKSLINRVQNSALRVENTINWAGRVMWMNNKDFAYKKVNHLIQSSCADVIKIAMNRLAIEMAESRGYSVLQVHDELLFELPPEEYELIPMIQETMESIYKPRNGMILTTSVAHSLKGWGHRQMIKGAPTDGRGKTKGISGSGGRPHALHNSD